MATSDYDKLDDELDRVLASSSARLSKSYDGRLADLRAYLAALDSRYSTGDDLVTYSELSKFGRFEQVKEDVGGLSRDLYADIRADVDTDLRNVYAVHYSQTAGVLTRETNKFVQQAVRVDALEKAMKAPVAGLTVDLRLDQYEQDLTQRILRQINLGTAQGWTPKRLADSMSDVFEGNTSYLRRMIETDAHRVAEDAKADAAGVAEEEGANLRKKWRSRRDQKVRSAHNFLDREGKLLKLNENFRSPTGGVGPRPGRMGRPEDDAYCRCILVYVPVDEEGREIKS